MATSADPIRVLFVDDEPSVLDGLRVLLRKHRREWTMEFVGSGAEALAALHRAPFDVVVSDMRMPGMDGATLLNHVKDAFPGVVRIILSGQAEMATVIKALPCTHQFVTKPCDPESLPAIIRRATSLRNGIDDDHRTRLMARFDDLPTPPKIYAKLLSLIDTPNVTLDKVADLLETDPTTAASVLRLTSSSFFGMSRSVSTVARAITMLGLDLIANVTLAAGVFRSRPALATPGVSLETLQAHSMATARLARRIAESKPVADTAYTAGLLHELGQIVIAATFPERMPQILAAAAAGSTLDAAERSELGFDHTTIGAYVLGVWGLPNAIVEAVACQCAPGQGCDAAAPAGQIDAATALHVADVLIGRHLPAIGGAAAVAELDLDHLRSRGLADRVPRWEELAAEQLREGAA